MRSGYFDLETRAIVNADPFDSEPGVWRICRVNTPFRHRGQGLAGRLLDEICADADQEGVTLILEPSPDGSPGSLPFDELVAFYGRRGFVMDQDGMRRRPRPFSTYACKVVNGREVAVVPLIMGTARLTVGPAGFGFVDDSY